MTAVPYTLMAGLMNSNATLHYKVMRKTAHVLNIIFVRRADNANVQTDGSN